MRYLRPRDQTKKAHLADDSGTALCRNQSIPWGRYTLWEGELQADAVCGNCASVSFADNPDNFKIERCAEYQCKCCGHTNQGVGTLEFGFYCQQCGEYWRFKERLNPLPPFREPTVMGLPWE